MSLADTTGDGAAANVRAIDAAAVMALDEQIAAGGIAVVPTDTVYGLATDPGSEMGVRRLYELKRRRPTMPSAVMFASLALALAALPDLGPRTLRVLEVLLPGPLTLIVSNPAHCYPLACGPDPDRLGIRVPELAGVLAPLAAARHPVLQSSANLHGGLDPCRLADIPAEIRAAADLVLDAGEKLPGVASTVVDLSRYEKGGDYEVLREGAVPAADLDRHLSALR